MTGNKIVFKSKKTTFVIICFVFVMIIVYIMFSNYRLVKHGILVNAKTTNWKSGASGSLNLGYAFVYNDDSIEGANVFEGLTDRSEFENRYFPVLYDTTLGTTQLLIRPTDFEAYHLPFPDSLKWVLKYIK